MDVNITLSQDADAWSATAEAFPHIRAIAPTREQAISEIERLLRTELGWRLTTPKDDHSQPLSHWYNLRIRRKADEMIGLLRGIIADDEVSAREIEKLAEWLYMNQEAAMLLAHGCRA